MTDTTATAYVSHTDPTQGWDSNDGYDELEYDDDIMIEDELNDLLVIACIDYERRLEQSGMIRSVIYFNQMVDILRDGENKIFLKMIKEVRGFAQFITKRHANLIPLVTANIGPICSPIA